MTEKGKAAIKSSATSFVAFYKKNYLLLEVILILGLSLIPLLWFKNDNQIVIGHDAGFPLNPWEWFTNRLSAWNEKYNFGADQSFALGSLPIHFLEAVLAFSGLSIFIVQKLIFVFWFVSPALSMYVLSRYIIGKEAKYSVFRIIAPIFYILNHYTLQGWFIAERTKFSILVASPLVVYFMLKGLDKKISTIASIVFANLVLVFFNGGGSAFTLYGGLILILASVLIGYLITKRINLKEFILYPITFGLIFLLLNAYWIIPQLYYSFNSFSTVISTFGGIESTIRWADEISKHASLGNLLRLQGIPDWYDNPTHPYSGAFLTNRVLIVASYFIPVLTLLAFVIYRKKEGVRHHLVWLFILTIVALIFTAGTHEPFGFIYRFLLKNVPLFTTFRTPFYKFGYALWFAFSILSALSVNYIANLNLVNLKLEFLRLKNKPIFTISWKKIVIVALVILLALYNFPFFTGSFFKWRDPFTTKVELPGYVQQYESWAAKEPANIRILMLPQLPENNIDIYKWGYYSLEPLPSLLSSKTIVSNNLSLISTEEEKQFLGLLYSSLLEDPATFEKLTREFGINRLLLRKDVSFDIPGFETTNPKVVEDALSKVPAFIKTEEWEQWSVYESAFEPEKVSLYDSPVQVYNTGYRQADIATLLSEIEGGSFFQSDIDYEEFQKIVFLNSLNLTDISEENNALLYDVPQLKKGKIVLEPNSIENFSLNIKVKRIGQATYSLSLQYPTIKVDYGGQTQEIKGKEITKTFTAEKENFGLIINGKNYKIESLKLTEERIIGSISLNGLTSSSAFIYYPDQVESLTNVDFEIDNLNGNVGVCGGDDANAGSSIQTDPKKGKYLELRGGNGSTACLRLPVTITETDSLYQFMFDYRWDSGLIPSYCVLQTGESDECLPMGNVPNAKKGVWNNFTTEFVAKEGTSQLVIHLYARSEEGQTINSFDNIVVGQMPKKEVFSITSEELSTLTPEKTELSVPSSRHGYVRLSTNLFKQETDEIIDGSFEETLWGGAAVCGVEKGKNADVSATFADDSTQGNNSLKLSAYSGTACIRQKISDFSRGNIYKIEFDYKNISGNPPSLCVLQMNSKVECLPKEEFSKSSDWQHFSDFIIPANDAEDLVIHLYSKAAGSESTNLFDNIKITKINDLFSGMYLMEERTEKSESLLDHNVMRNDSSFYQLRITNASAPFMLKLDNSFNSNWKLFINDPNKSLIENLTSFLENDSGHVRVNGYANGWYIDTAEKSEVVISLIYIPHILFVFSSIISLLALLFTLIFAFGFSVKNLRKKVAKQKEAFTKIVTKLDNILIEP